MASPSIEARFPAAAISSPPTQEQRQAVAALRADAVEFAARIDAVCPDGRDKSLALTHLEDALMRANRALFAG